MTNFAESHLSTHEVLNQPLPLADINLFEGDAALKEGLAREGAGAQGGLFHWGGALNDPPAGAVGAAGGWRGPW